MGRTLSQIVIDIESIIECEHGNVVVEELFDERILSVTIREEDLDDSRFNREQLEHLVDVLTLRVTKTKVSVLSDEEWAARGEQ